MDQAKIGAALFVFLAVPPVARFMESVMVLHMHMQMPLLVVAGLLMAPFVQKRFPGAFERWNPTGIPGILLFAWISCFWLLPRAMDEALTIPGMEIFKFASLPFLAGIPLRDSWRKLGAKGQKWVVGFFAAVFMGMGLLYIFAPVRLCNNYLEIEQLALGWGFVFTAAGMIVYLVYSALVAPAEYEETS